MKVFFQKREEHRVKYNSGGRSKQVDYIFCRSFILKEISGCKVAAGGGYRRTTSDDDDVRKRTSAQQRTKWCKMKKRRVLWGFMKKRRNRLWEFRRFFQMIEQLELKWSWSTKARAQETPSCTEQGYEQPTCTSRGLHRRFLSGAGANLLEVPGGLFFSTSTRLEESVRNFSTKCFSCQPTWTKHRPAELQ